MRAFLIYLVVIVSNCLHMYPAFRSNNLWHLLASVAITAASGLVLWVYLVRTFRRQTKRDVIDRLSRGLVPDYERTRSSRKVA